MGTLGWYQIATKSFSAGLETLIGNFGPVSDSYKVIFFQFGNIIYGFMINIILGLKISDCPTTLYPVMSGLPGDSKCDVAIAIYYYNVNLPICILKIRNIMQ